MKALLQTNSNQIPLADSSVQMVATSPPYFGLRDYGLAPTDWPAMSYAPMAGLPPVEVPAMSACLGLEPDPLAYIGHLVLIARELRRVLADDGVLWLNLGDSYAGSGAGGGGNRKGNEHGQHDSMVIIGRPRVENDLKPKDLIAIPWRAALALQADGWYLRSDVIWHKPNPMPESVTDRPTKAHEYVFMLAKSARYFYDADAVRQPQANSSLSRQKYGVSDHHKIINGAPGQTPHTFHQPRNHDASRNIRKFANRRTVWTIATQPTPYAHFATWPEALVEIMIKATSRPGDIVLDPFAGSGTTVQVAHNLGRHGVGLDLSGEYLRDIARGRTSTTFGVTVKRESKPLEELPMFKPQEA